MIIKYATYYENKENHLIVQCFIKNGIYYLKCKDKYLNAADNDDKHFNEITLIDSIPEKYKRLQFHFTKNNTFKVVKWNQNIYLTMEMITSNYSSISFDDREETIRYGEHLELYLESVL
jgi:hypothetical protein